MKTPLSYIALTLAWLIIVPTHQAAAADDNSVKTYEGEVAGIFCSACSSHVKAALLTIDGVKTVKITAAPAAGGLPRVRITATRPITRDLALKALGEKAKLYDIRSLKPAVAGQ
jgi:copper chaperone CopZ